MDVRLDGRRALVTGAGSGIGRAVALGLAAAGADVAVNDLEPSDGLAETAAGVREKGRRVLVVPADVSQAAAVTDMFERVSSELGGLDLHVNNAGVMVRKPLLAFAPAEWERLLGVNLTGYVLCGTAAARLMLRNDGPARGAILNICSPTYDLLPTDQRGYATTKGGVHTFSRALAAELTGHRIRVNAIEPGATPTGINTEMAWRRRAGAENANPQSVSGRFAWPEDIARLAVFLLSDCAAHITGADVRVDGGLSLLRDPPA